MKTLLALTAVLGLSSTAIAQSTTTPPTTSSPSTSSPSTTAPSMTSAQADARFTALDKNKDGVIDAREADAALKSAMAKVDLNKDGKVTRAEYMAGVASGHIQ